MGKYKMKDIIFILFVSVVLFGIPYILALLEVEKYKNILANSWYIYALLFIAVFFYICNPKTVRQIVCQICAKKIEDTTGIAVLKNEKICQDSNKDIDNLKKEIQKNKITIDADSNEIIKKHTKSKESIKLKDDFLDGKYEKIILDAKNGLLNDNISPKEEFVYRMFMEFAYSEMNLDQYTIDDRVENLKKIIDNEFSKNKAMQSKLMLMLSQCYLLQNKFVKALDISYKVFSQIKKNEDVYSSKFIANFYFLQMGIFISQDKPIQAILAAKESIKFADRKQECDLYYIISNIYFTYLNNTKEALEYALKCWAIIYQDAAFQTNLVFLCYYSYFFEKKYKEAAEFLENYTMTEKTKKYYANLSYLLYKTGQFEKAKEFAEKAIDYEKEKAVSAKNTLAMLAMDANNYEKGIYLFSEILPSFEEDKDSNYGKYFYAEVLYNRGKCYAKLGNYLKAHADITAALNAGFEDIDIHLLEEIEYNVIDNKVEDQIVTSTSSEKMEETNAK